MRSGGCSHPRMTTPPISSPPFRPYGPAASWDTHACPPRDVARPADPRIHRSKVHPHLLRQEVRQERRTRGTVEGPRLPARGRHLRRPVAGPASSPRSQNSSASPATPSTTTCPNPRVVASHSPRRRTRRNCPNPPGQRTDHRRSRLVTAFLPAPRAGQAWTDSAERHDKRGLKSREAKEDRPVPVPRHSWPCSAPTWCDAPEMTRLNVFQVSVVGGLILVR